VVELEGPRHREERARLSGGVVLETDRLRLRRFVLEDAPQLARLDADAAVRRYVGSTPPPTESDYHETILPRWISHYAEGPFGYWCAEVDGDFVGWFHLRPDRERHGAQDLGYRLVREVWGQGLATEGGRALVAAGFDEWGARTITAHCLAANLASARVLEKCGLSFVREFVVPERILPGTPAEFRRARAYELGLDVYRAARI